MGATAVRVAGDQVAPMGRSYKSVSGRAGRPAAR